MNFLIFISEKVPYLLHVQVFVMKLLHLTADRTGLQVINFFLAQLAEAVQTSTHNVCFGSKIKENRNTLAYPSFAI